MLASRKEPVVFNRENLDKWHKEIPVVSFQIGAEEKKREAASLTVTENQEEFNHYSSEISRLDNLILLEQVEIARLEAEQASKKDESGWEVFAFIVADVIDRSVLASYQEERRELYPRYNQLNSLMQRNNQIITDASSTIKNLEKRRQELEKLTLDCNQYLTDLSSDPKKLFTNLKDKILSAIQDYEQKTAAQSRPVRKALHRLQEKIDIIASNVAGIEGIREEVDDIKPMERREQIRYAELCGLLFHTFNQIEAHDSKLVASLISVLGETHIARNGDLPDQYATGFTCIQLYSQLQKMVEGLADINNEELVGAEDQEFKQAKTKLNDSKNNLVFRPDLFRDVFKKLQDEIDEKRISNPDGTKFYTSILEQTEQLYQAIGTPQFHVKYDNYIELAKIAEGNPSCGRMLAGILFFIAGITLIAASILALVVTKGASAYLSDYLAKLGTYCAEQGMGMVLAASGIITILSSIGLMSRWGVARKMHNIASQADREDKRIKRSQIDINRDEADEKGEPPSPYAPPAPSAPPAPRSP